MNHDQSILNALLTSPYALVVIRRKSCSILAVNPAFANSLGYDPQTWIGKHLKDIPVWADPNVCQWFADRMNTSGCLNHWVADFKSANETRSPFLLSTTPVTLAGHEHWVLVSGRENSEQKQIEASLKHSESLYREAQRIARLGHWELDIRSNRLVWSDEIYRIFDINPDEFTASYETFLGLIHPEDRDHVDRVYRASLEEKTPYDVIHRLLMRDGGIKYVHERGQSRWDEHGEPLRSFGTVQDITELKNAEMEHHKIENQLRQSQRLEAVGTLAGGIAHDFNNILFAILGYTEMSMDLAAPESHLYHNLKKVHDAGNRAKELVFQILTFCRRKSEKKTPVPIREIVEEVLTMIRATLPTSIRIFDQLASSAMVSANSGQIHQVIMNLCTNAAYAMKHKDTGVLTVELEDVDFDEIFVRQFVDVTPGPYVKLSISDTGEGMSEEVGDRIFEPFFTTKGEGEGSGLGLSVVHGIVKNHDGQILVYSEPGIGTTFKIFLPVITTRKKDAAGKRPDLPRGAEHIMLVDDEPMIIDVMRAMLKSLGYSVETFVDSIRAFEVFQSGPQGYDLIITDMTMPGMNGLRLSEKILAVRSDIPVIITTGFSEKITEAMIQNAGIKTLLFKPIVKYHLAMAVRQSLDESIQEAEPQV